MMTKTSFLAPKSLASTCFIVAVRDYYLPRLSFFRITMPKRKATKSKAAAESTSNDDTEGSASVAKKKVSKAEESGQDTANEKQYKFESFKTKTTDGQDFNLKMILWNVAGLKAWVKKGCLDHLRNEDADIVCLQETKCLEKDAPDEINQFKRQAKLAFSKEESTGYYMYWCEAEKKGYSGVSLWSKVKPLKITYGIGNSTFDSEGRAITAEYENYYVMTTYVPNSGRQLVRLSERQGWDKSLREYVKKLDSNKPVVLCGDMNVAHTEIDLANPKTNKKNAGFTQEERDGFTELLNTGFVDTFRYLHPDVLGAYSFWTFMGNARERNVGWRLDYFVCSDRIKDKLCDSAIQQSIKGSDHCPLVMLMAM